MNLRKFLEDVILQKGKWEHVALKDLSQEMLDKLWEMYIISYDYVKLRFSKIKDISDKYRLAYVIDWDRDPNIDSFIIYKLEKYGNKIVMLGSDGQSTSKKLLLSMVTNFLKHPYWYIEASGKLINSLQNSKVPCIDKFENVIKVLNKKIEWLDAGKYMRYIDGLGDEVKMMFGCPKC